MENDPTFDAGRGSFLNRAGEVELDAMVMDGRDLSVGAVAAVRNILIVIDSKGKAGYAYRLLFANFTE